MSHKILIVEDEMAIADIIAFNLQRDGFTALVANDGQAGLTLALEENPDLILLDVMLPIMDGFEVCRRVRAVSHVPIIMLTAREEESDKIYGLDLGADDYVTKPFSMRELISRIRANVRRTQTLNTATTPTVATPKIHTGITLLHDSKDILKDGVPVEVSLREFDIIAFLASQAGKVVSREQLMEKVWGYEYYGDLRAVDVAIRRLREKLEDNPAQPQYIITKRGAGYYFGSEDE